MNIHDRVKETTTTATNGDITLAGAVTQFKSFSSRYATNELFPQVIVGQSGTEWETGIGYLSGATTLVRYKIIQSSNSDSVVTLSAGTKDIFVYFMSRQARNLIGKSNAMNLGMALP